MQFKNPYILYALFLLLIPIIVHLFQLRRFKKTPFSNLAFLQTVVKNTRKSATIKKWLILATRLLALGALILAFSQPFIPNSFNATQEREQVIFLDNSFSMQARGDKGPLLTEAVQELIASGKTDFKLVTLDQTYTNLDVSQDQNTLLNLDYSAEKSSPEVLNLALNNAFSKDKSTLKQLIVISDFQSFDSNLLDSLNTATQHWVHLKPVENQNIYLDSLKITRKDTDYLLNIQVKASEISNRKIPVSLYNGNTLISKATASFENNRQSTVDFRISSKEPFLGSLRIKDPGITYDNSFYFYLDRPEPLNILSINNASDDFLQKIYNGSDYKFSSIPLKKLDYNLLNSSEVVILNELESIPQSLLNRLSVFKNEGGQVIFIPNSNAEASVYDNFLKAFNTPRFSAKNTGDYKITSINYDHPVYQNVFERRGENFQYPSIVSSFNLTAPSAALRLQNGNAFLVQNDGVFIFSAALNSANSNFQDSPLVVPTFEEMAKTALQLPQSYYYLGENKNFDLRTQSSGDAVYKLRRGDQVIIPLQEKQANVVNIPTKEGIEKDGIYDIIYKDSIMGQVAFNYNRQESLIPDKALTNTSTASLYNSVSSALVEIQQASSINELFKWFLILAGAFLLCEMLILKFFK